MYDLNYYCPCPSYYTNTSAYTVCMYVVCSNYSYTHDFVYSMNVTLYYILFIKL